MPGVPQRYATAVSLNGRARGVLVSSLEGRPIKVAGNPSHPFSLGATDVFAEAELMQLYDPDRSRAVRGGGKVGTWEGCLAALLPRLNRLAQQGGEGLALLTGPLASPTRARLIAAARQRFPRLAWHEHNPVGDDNARQGARLAFGRPLTLLPRLDRCQVVLCLDADPLGPGDDQLRNARGFAARRQAREGDAQFLRLYAMEPGLSLTGANADHHRGVHPAEFPALLTWLAAELGAKLPRPSLPDHHHAFLRVVADDLRAHRGAALVLPGEALAPELHALAHWINHRLDAPIEAVEPFGPQQDGPAPLAELAEAMHRGAVDTLLILGANPAYDAPGDLGFPDALRRVPFAMHHGLHVDETAALCHWHVPAPHTLESWGDLLAADGTAAIVQPLIRPLYASRPDATLLGLLAGTLDQAALPAVRETWKAGRDDAAFDAWWRTVLEAGVVPDSAAARVQPPEPRLPSLPPVQPADNRLALVLRPDPSTWDGTYANNAWLQECPRPLTRQVWGNAALIGTEEAARRGIRTGDVLRLAAGGSSVEAPAMVMDGIAPGVVMLTIGQGRPRAGAIGNDIGVNAYPLRRTDAPWVVPGLELTRLDRQETVLLAHSTHRLQGEARELLPVVDLAHAFGPSPPEPPPADFYPDFHYPDAAWAMVIDTSLCIGCNACVVACQSENNVPVVGPEQVAVGRDMHWLRIDTYTQDLHGESRPGFQPVPCMHCEKAPCEPVCPVEASVHDHEGLNVQVYNRCIGTRFCQSNCPYKVRRFNFRGYADGQEYANLGEPIVAAQHNPDVTVRARGVMEKCTYCVQRISAARRAAEREDRPIGDGEVVTACQAACPTRAIMFGDLNRPASAPARLRRQPHHFALLASLNTRPRTTYLKRVLNPNPLLERDA